MHYSGITPAQAQGLLCLRARIAEARIPPSALDESLNVATWNVREFGRKRRSDTAILFIAEIVSQFDLVALTELRSDLADLKRLMERLGRYWKVVMSDFIDDPGGNEERIAYLYDSRMVVFTGLAAEADAPRVERGGERLPEFSWWRAPYMASFAAGSFDFVVLAAHIRWGSGVNDRLRELDEFRQWVVRRRSTGAAVDNDFIVLGDFNVPSLRSSAYRALSGDPASPDLMMPAGLAKLPGSNLERDARYDQILHSPTQLDRFSGRGGVLDFYAGDWAPLYPEAASRPKTRAAFTRELSDHLPLWLQVRTDFEQARLEALAGA
ncbi:MAG TPA: endonuclease/exonuclease/phosphatase family protein [Alphaproteobacteria bacterium]|nr:endonuclease/exonuclease/phosphatase family protein [Alphaproteobacteria bacterium]